MKHYSKEFKEEALKLSDEIGVKASAPEEIACRSGWISKPQLLEAAESCRKLPSGEYQNYYEKMYGQRGLSY